MKQKNSNRITIRDIASHCGVSLATASRVLSGSDYPVNETTRETILKASQELGYIPNSTARNLRSSLQGEISVVIPTLSNPFYTSLVAGFEAVVSSLSNNLVLYISSAYSDHNVMIQNIIGRSPRGILVASPTMYTAFLEAAAGGTLGEAKLVFADCPSPQNTYNSVCFDYKKGTYIGTDFLIKKGHRSIVYAAMPLDRESRRLRVQGFKEALLANGLSFSEDALVSPCDETLKDDNQLIATGDHLAELILKKENRPTAIVAVNDMVAFGILRCLRRNGISVPEDISVIGFDDTIFCDACNPPLTTIKVQDEQIGRMSGMLLLNEMDGKPSGVTLFVEPSLVERDSVCAPN